MHVGPALLTLLVACRHEDPSPTCEGEMQELWLDEDGDSYGSTSSTKVCERVAGLSDNSLDCDDGNASVHPGAVEACNDIDDDCDGVIAAAPTWYEDADGDGYGAIGAGTSACDAPSGFLADGLDCDDGNAAANPAASESCGNDYDDDCDGVTELGTDADGDGYASVACAGGLDCDDGNASVHDGAPETCGNGVDDDCDGFDSACAFVGEIDIAGRGCRSDIGRLRCACRQRSPIGRRDRRRARRRPRRRRVHGREPGRWVPPARRTERKRLARRDRILLRQHHGHLGGEPVDWGGRRGWRRHRGHRVRCAVRRARGAVHRLRTRHGRRRFPDGARRGRHARWRDRLLRPRVRPRRRQRRRPRGRRHRRLHGRDVRDCCRQSVRRVRAIDRGRRPRHRSRRDRSSGKSRTGSRDAR